MKEKVVIFGVGGIVKKDEEVSESSQSSLGEWMKENNEVSHVMTTIKLGSVDLKRDQFLGTLDSVPSSITISSPIKDKINFSAKPPMP